MSAKPTKNQSSLATIAKIFLRAGMTSFGGWSALAILLEDDVVKRRKLLTELELSTSVAYAQLLPGATQIAIVSGVGHRLRNTVGAVVATLCYLMPTVVLTTLFAVVYFNLTNKNLTPIINGLIPVLCGIILANGYRLGRKHITTSIMWLVVATSLIMQFALHINTLLIIIGFGLLGLTISFRDQLRKEN